MLNNEFTTVPNIELTSANTNEIDFSLVKHRLRFNFCKDRKGL